MKALILAMAAIVMLSCISEDSPGGDGSRVRTGDPAPEFTVGDFSSPEDFTGRKSLLVFFIKGCPDCGRELPFVEYAYQQLSDLQVIAIGRGETEESIERYWSEMGLDTGIPRYPDTSKAIYNLFAEYKVPRIYLIDETGTIVWMATENLGYGEFTAEKGDAFNALITNKLNI